MHELSGSWKGERFSRCYTMAKLGGWVDKVGSVPARYVSSQGSNPDIPPKLQKGDISKGMANTL